MDIQFVKLQSCGLDYLLLDGFKSALPDEANIAELSRAIVPRRIGVGAYGFLLFHHGKTARTAGRLFDRRGREVNPGADAIRCMARYGFDCGLLGYEGSRIETSGGVVSVRMLDNRNVAVRMPAPTSSGSPMNESANCGEELLVDGRAVPFTPVEMRGPHAVFLGNPRIRVPRIIRALREHPLYREQPPTVVLAQVFSADEVRLHAWRSAGRELPARGEAAGSATAAAFVHGFTGREVLVHFRGGDLFVNWNEREDEMIIAGAVDYVFTGTYYWETWEGEL